MEKDPHYNLFTNIILNKDKIEQILGERKIQNAVQSAFQEIKNKDPSILLADLLHLNRQEREILGNLLGRDRTTTNIKKIVLSALHLQQMNEAFLTFVNEDKQWQKTLALQRRQTKGFSHFVTPDEKQMAETFVVQGNSEDHIETCNLKLNGFKMG
ncbi:hypothetical protein GOBAR_DD14950 [Gossypium barbadense]|nr:hypothetical protein GOBAR_DD14950 [Gossypium barbadense]